MLGRHQPEKQRRSPRIPCGRFLLNSELSRGSRTSAKFNILGSCLKRHTHAKASRGGSSWDPCRRNGLGTPRGLLKLALNVASFYSQSCSGMCPANVLHATPVARTASSGRAPETINNNSKCQLFSSGRPTLPIKACRTHEPRRHVTLYLGVGGFTVCQFS